MRRGHITASIAQPFPQTQRGSEVLEISSSCVTFRFKKIWYFPILFCLSFFLHIFCALCISYIFCIHFQIKTRWLKIAWKTRTEKVEISQLTNKKPKDKCYWCYILPMQRKSFSMYTSDQAEHSTVNLARLQSKKCRSLGCAQNLDLFLPLWMTLFGDQVFPDTK